MLPRLRSFVRVLTARRDFEAGMKEELRFHIEQYTADLVASGVSPEEAARRAREIAGLANDLLLDVSGGQGRPLDPAALLPFLRALADTGLGLGVAGGLSASNLHLLEPLLAELPELSFDAETCLRDEEDRLDLERVREYVQAGLRL